MNVQKPSWSLLDRKHAYVNSASTDIRATFALARSGASKPRHLPIDNLIAQAQRELPERSKPCA